MGNHEIRRIAQSIGGMIDDIVGFRSSGDQPKISIQSARMRLSRRSPRTLVGSELTITGTGTGLNSEQCILPCLAETLERYSTQAFSKEQFIVASGNELGSAALDLNTIPRCSERELQHPKCRLKAPDKGAPIRWLHGLSLHDGRLVYLPVVMAYLHAGVICPEERFWFPITTGCAAHASFEQAIISAILEIIERDALSILWLQQLRLPMIEVDEVPSALEFYWEQHQGSSEDLEYYFFNATTDLGFPTIYGVQRARANTRLTTLVSCSSAFDPITALTKVMRDMAACRNGATRGERAVPENWDDFTTIFHGARFMARAEQAHAFNFLLESGQKQLLSDFGRSAIPGTGNDRQDLRMVLMALKKAGLDVYAIDITADEALRAGVRVVQVLIPGLQPVGFQYRSRYLGHPRLYEAPQKMGYPGHSEDAINPWPQPFA